MSLRDLALAVSLALAVAGASVGAPVYAVAAPSGSKNFTSPAYVPNYFSNEGGSFQGNATARPAQPGAAPAFAAAPARGGTAVASRRIGRHHAGRAASGRGHFRVARGRGGGHRHVVRARAAHARVVHVAAARGAKAAGPRAAHAQRAPAHGKAVAAKSRPAPGKGRSAARGRG